MPRAKTWSRCGERQVVVGAVEQRPGRAAVHRAEEADAAGAGVALAGGGEDDRLVRVVVAAEDGDAADVDGRRSGRSRSAGCRSARRGRSSGSWSSSRRRPRRRRRRRCCPRGRTGRPPGRRCAPTLPLPFDRRRADGRPGAAGQRVGRVHREDAEAGRRLGRRPARPGRCWAPACWKVSDQLLSVPGTGRSTVDDLQRVEPGAADRATGRRGRQQRLLRAEPAEERRAAVVRDRGRGRPWRRRRPCW